LRLRWGLRVLPAGPDVHFGRARRGWIASRTGLPLIASRPGLTIR